MADISKFMPNLSKDVNVLVVGEPGCGKTTFIRTFCEQHNPWKVHSFNNGILYSCRSKVYNQPRTVKIVEISENPEYVRQLYIEYMRANVIVFMYAIDDPKSFEMLSDNWILPLFKIITKSILPAVFVGNKTDLRENQLVIESLARQNLTPVTKEQGSGLYFDPFHSTSQECSSLNPKQVEIVFDSIFNALQISSLRQV